MTRIFVSLVLIGGFLAWAANQPKPPQESPCEPSKSIHFIEAQGVTLAERQALVALFKATDGDHWKNREGWLGPRGTECNWHGVTCKHSVREPTNVIEVELVDNNLVGSIPKELRQLTHLEDANFYGNHLSGRFPVELIRRWETGALGIGAEAHLFTGITEVDFEWAATALLCARRRTVLRSDNSVAAYTERCRNATPDDRATYCEVKQGHLFLGEFTRLGWMLERNGFFQLPSEYDRPITHGIFEQTRVKRGKTVYEVSNYATAGPAQLWSLQRAIEGVAAGAEWEKTTTLPECPRW